MKGNERTPKCPKHNYEYGFYYRSGDIENPGDWQPKNKAKAREFYELARTGDMGKMAQVMGEAQMIHSGESSSDSAFISVARCPHCLLESDDDDVQAILRRYHGKMYVFQLPPGTALVERKPFVFEMAGSGVGAGETECLVLLFPGRSLKEYWTGGVVTPERK